MKNKLMKYWGIALVLAILAGLLVPAMPASAGNMVWTQLITPAPTGPTANGVLVNVGAGGSQWLFDVAADGKTMFAYDNTATNNKLYKSTNGGLSWSTANITANNLDGQNLVDLKVSSNYANDTTVVAATSATSTTPNAIFRSADGGATWAPLVTTTAVGAAGTITSVDAGLYSTGGQTIVFGTSNGAGGGSAFRFAPNTLTWSNLGFGPGDVLGIALAPNPNDAEVLAVTTNASGTFLQNNIANVNYPAATIALASVAGSTPEATRIAEIVLPADYTAAGNNTAFVGLGRNIDALTTIPAADDVYRVKLAFVGQSPTVVDLNASGSGNSTNVFSLSFKGNLVDGNLYVGQKNSTVVKHATTVNASTVTFVDSAKNPSGTSNVIVRASKVATDTAVYAITSGPNSALSLSNDNGNNFNAISLIAVIAANTSVSSLAIVDANTMYAILQTGTATQLIKTTNAGANWTAIFNPGTVLTNVYPSPAYATDKTLYVTESSGVIWKSADAGLSFVGYFSPNAATVTAFAPVDGANYFVATAAGFFKGGSTSAATGITGTVNAIEYMNATTLFVGTSNGVFMSADNGVTFTQVGTSGAFSGGVTLVQADVAYATNKVVYAVDANGIHRFTIGGTNVDWSTAASGTAGTNALVQSPDGTMYATANPNSSGVLRSISPAAGPQTYESMKTTAVAGIPAAATGFRGLTVIPTGTAQVPNNTLYVVAIGAAGSTGGNADQVFTVQDTAVAAPAVTSPANNANVSTPVDFTWAPVSIPAGISVRYALQVGLDTAFNAKVIDLAGDPASDSTPGISGTLLANQTLAAGETYYWRVRIDAGAPLTSKWSAVNKFTVQLAQAGSTLNLLAPTAGATGIATKPVLSWSAVAGAASYDLQVADNPVFVNPIDSQTGLNTTVWTETKTLDPNKVYYWRVRALSASGVASDWVNGTFTTAAPAPSGTATGGPATTATVTTTAPAVTTTITATPAARFFDPNSGLYFNSQQDLQNYQNAHPSGATTPAPATPAYIWVIIAIGAILIIAVIVLIARTRRV